MSFIGSAISSDSYLSLSAKEGLNHPIARLSHFGISKFSQGKFAALSVWRCKGKWLAEHRVGSFGHGLPDGSFVWRDPANHGNLVGNTHWPLLLGPLTYGDPLFWAEPNPKPDNKGDWLMSVSSQISLWDTEPVEKVWSGAGDNRREVSPTEMTRWLAWD